MENFEKPTIEQVAWVFNKIKDARGGSFCYLIYDCMGFDSSAYFPLYLAGGMAIMNAMNEIYGENNLTSPENQDNL